MSYIIRSCLRHSCRIASEVCVRNCTPLRLYVPITHSKFIATQSRTNPVSKNRTSFSIEEHMKKLDDEVRKKNRLEIQHVERILENMEGQNTITPSQAQILIRCCGKLLPAERTGRRIELMEKVWKTIKQSKTQLDVSHYNALLKVYLENEYEFSPSNIFAEMDRNSCEPNRITYQRLMKRYCQLGDMDGASEILKIMQQNELPANVSIFNVLLLGHCNIDDMESAEGVLSMLKSSQMNPDGETYSTLIVYHVKQGNFHRVYELLKEAKTSGIHLDFEHYFVIIEAYAKYGFEEEVEQVLKSFHKSSTYNVDAQNLCLRLIAQNRPEAAYRVLKTIPSRNLRDGTILAVGDFFIDQLIKCDIPSDNVLKYCHMLMNDNLNPNALLVAMESSLRLGKESMALDLFRAAKKKNIEIRHHYFWPLLAKRGKENDCPGIIDILYVMTQEFGIVPNTELIREYVVPVLLRNNWPTEQIMFSLKGCGVSVAACVSSIVISLLEKNKLREAVEIAENYNSMYSYYVIKNPLIQSLIHTKDFDSFARMLREVACGCDWFITKHKLINDQEPLESLPSDFREITGRLLEYAIVGLNKSNFNADELIENICQAMVDYKVGITAKSAVKIKNLLPEKISSKTIDLLNVLSSEQCTIVPPKTKGSRITFSQLDEKTLERLKANMKVRNEDITDIQKYLFTTYTRNNNEEKAVKLLKEMEENESKFTVSMHLSLLNMYAELGKLGEAMKIYETIRTKAPQFQFDSIKLLKLIHLLVFNKQPGSAMEIMEAHSPKNMELEDVMKPSYKKNTLCRQILEMLADAGDVERVEKFCELFLSSGLGEPNNIVLGPTIKVHVVNNDAKTALEKLENYVRKYRILPCKNELVRFLIEKEDAVRLQRLTDLSSEVHGENNTIHDLLLSFIECGHIKQARKMLQMPNFVMKNDRILNASYRYHEEGAVDKLRNILTLVKDINFSERPAIYYLLLSIYNKAGDVDNALALWTEIQEENLQPTDEFLITLANLLVRNKRPVPFTVPQKDEKTRGTLKRDFGKVKLSSISMKMRSLISRGKLQEALDLKNKCTPEQLNKTDWALLLEACVQADRYEDAKAVFNEHVQTSGELPLYKVAKFFLGAAMKAGDVEFLEKLISIVSEDEKKRLSFDNHLCRAYINANRGEECLWMLEQGFQKVTKTRDKMKAFALSFPRGGMLSLMLSKPEWAARGEKLLMKILEESNSSVIANSLWIYYMSVKNYEHANRIWNSWFRDSIEPISFQKLTTDIVNNADTDLGMKLIDFIEGKSNIVSRTEGVVYGQVIKAFAQRNCIEEALELLERANKRIGIENVMRSALVTLKAACKAKNINFPYEESMRRVELEDAEDEHVLEGSSL